MAMRIKSGSSVISNDSGSFGLKDDGAEIMWQRDKAEVTEIAGFTPDSNNVSESDYNDEYTKEKSTKKKKPIQRRGNEKRFGFSMFEL
ncbi:hypothetical protein ES332_A05G063900v1 [Gossypium tomentosum]|uniref:Uncharacterized protein n=1 Tax=Gossypium tomentosum TaxID=34277 RepID=A0A5D2QC31_GOSTO|nr:hypothetical protein ES332_A05G063900v1 [Gossypium tomentosum]